MLYIFLSLAFIIYITYVSAVNVQFLEPSQEAAAAVDKPFWWHCKPLIEGPHFNNIIFGWRFNDANIQNTTLQSVYTNGTLHLKQVSQRSVGQYQCVISIDGLEHYSRVSTLSLAFTGDDFKQHPVGHNISVQQTVVLSCEILSLPPADINWLFNGNKATVGEVVQASQYKSTLLIKNLSYFESGEYRCQAVNLVSEEVRFSDIAVVNVRGPPQLVMLSDPVTAVQGATIYLHCLVLGNPKPSIVWSKATGLPNNSVIYINGTLRVENVQEEDSGFYTCVATNMLGGIHHTVLVSYNDGYEAPMFTHPPSNLTIIAGQVVTITCTARGAPSPTVTWHNPHGELINSTYIPYAGALTLATEIALPGIWNTEARNTVGAILSKFSLTIHEKAFISSIPQDVTIIEEAYFQLPCICTGSPVPTTTWYLPNGHVVKSSTPYTSYHILSNGYLSIQAINCNDDNGIFRCLCENEVGTDSMDMRISVQCKPKIKQIPVNIEVHEGKSAVVHCDVIGRPQPQLLWYRTGSNIPLSSGTTYQVLVNDTLVLRTMKANMAGEYNCTAINSLGTAGHTFSINMLYKPSFAMENHYIPADIGESVLLSCYPDGYPAPTVYWRRKGLQIVEDGNMQVMSNSSLHIDSVSSAHYGDYECVATNSVGSASVVLSLTSSGEIYWIRKPRNATVTQGQSVTLHCAVVGQPMPTYKWYLQPNSSSPRHLVSLSSKGSLSLKKVRLSDQGIYTCEVSHNNYTVSSSALLNVTTTFVYIRNQTVEEGRNITLLASIFPLVSSITWYNPSGSKMGHSLSIYIADALIENDWGLWEIRGCNTTMCISEYIFLQVQGQPEISNYSMASNLTHITLQCVTKGSPVPVLVYYQSQTLISNSAIVDGHFVNTIGQTSLLVISKPMQQDAYSCVASNKYGVSRLKFNEPKSLEVIVDSSTPTSLTVVWAMDDPAYLPHIIGYRLVHTYRDIRTDIELLPPTVNYTLADLHPYTDHTVSISSYNVLGHSRDTVLSLRTEAAAPSSPRDVDVENKPGYLRISWSRPILLNGAADDIQYEVIVNIAEENYSHVYVTNDTEALFYPTTSGVIDIRLSAFNLESYYAEKHSPGVPKFVIVSRVEALSITPTDVTAILVAGNVFVSWNTIFGISVYSLLYQMDTGYHSAVLVNSTAFYELKNVVAGSTYSVQLAGVNSAGIGAYHNPIQIRIPDAESTTTNKDLQSGRIVNELNLLSILAIIIGSILIAVFGFVFSLILIYRRNRKRKLKEVYLDEGYKPSTVLGEYRSGDTIDRPSSNLQSQVSGDQDTQVPDGINIEGTEESVPNDRQDTEKLVEGKVILHGAERAVDVDRGEDFHSQLSTISTEEPERDDLVRIVAKMHARAGELADPIQVPAQLIDGKKGRRFKKLSEFNPRKQASTDSSLSISNDDNSAGTMSRRRPLTEKELY